MPADACRGPAPRILNEARGEIRDQYLCADKARRLLNWSSRYTLDEGLTRSIAWYQYYLVGHL